MPIPFKPSHLYIEKSIVSLPRTQKILNLFKNTPYQIVTHQKEIKKPQEMSWAKKGLFLSRFKSDLPLKNFEMMVQSAARPYFALNLISNCHLECTYCILQSYLANNPMITIYVNMEEILENLNRQIPMLPPRVVIGTGKIADSLALESITEFHATLIPFVGKQKTEIILELKTKTDAVDTLLNLDHQNKTVVSWSMNPQNIVEREEYKTASVAERLAAAKKCVAAGYKVGFHLDPMIVHEGWKKNYATLIEQFFDTVAPEKIAWLSLGVLRFPNRQKKMIERRFPKNRALFESLRHTHLPFLTYEPSLRQEMYNAVQGFIQKISYKVSTYLCMEGTHDSLLT